MRVLRDTRPSIAIEWSGRCQEQLRRRGQQRVHSQGLRVGQAHFHDTSVFIHVSPGVRRSSPAPTWAASSTTVVRPFALSRRAGCDSKDPAQWACRKALTIFSDVLVRVKQAAFKLPHAIASGAPLAGRAAVYGRVPERSPHHSTAATTILSARHRFARSGTHQRAEVRLSG